MLTTLGIVLFAIAIAISIALHELGHLLPAKLFGLRVPQYMIGFGPRIWSRQRGETEYGVKAIPIGGYCRMVGMFPPRPGDDGRVRTSTTGRFSTMIEQARQASFEEVRPGDDGRLFYQLPARKKIVVMLGGPVMNLIIAAVLIGGTLVGLGTPTLSTSVQTVSDCVIPAARTDQTTCRSGDPLTPAAKAGLRPGDTITAFNGTPITSWTQLQTLIRDAGGQKVTLGIDRGGQARQVSTTLVRTQRPVEANTPSGYTLRDVGFLGVSPGQHLVRASITSVPGTLADYTWRTASAVINIPARMGGVWQAAFSNAPRDPYGPIGVVGASRLGGEVAALPEPVSFKIVGFLLLVGSLNLALFVFNLIPLLPLDGGHVAGAIYEGARRKVASLRRRPDPGPADVTKMLPIAYTMAVLIVGMSALLLYADLVNPVRLGG